MPEITDLKPGYTEENMYEARNNGCRFYVQLDCGAVYAPIEGGMQSDGTSSEVFKYVQHYSRMTLGIQEYLSKEIHSILNEWEEIATSKINRNLKIHVELLGRYFVRLYEENNGIFIHWDAKKNRMSYSFHENIFDIDKSKPDILKRITSSTYIF